MFMPYSLDSLTEFTYPSPDAWRNPATDNLYVLLVPADRRSQRFDATWEDTSGNRIILASIHVTGEIRWFCTDNPESEHLGNTEREGIKAAEHFGLSYVGRG